MLFQPHLLRGIHGELLCDGGSCNPWRTVRNSNKWSRMLVRTLVGCIGNKGIFLWAEDKAKVTMGSTSKVGVDGGSIGF